MQKKVVDGEDAVEKKSYARDKGTQKIALVVVVVYSEDAQMLKISLAKTLLR